MKLIIAIIKPFKVEDVREELTQIGVLGMTATDVNGFGRQKGHTELYRGAEYVIDYVAKIRLEVAVTDDRVDVTVDAIIKGARTGKIGDGKIFIINQESVMRIRTGEMNEEAV